MPGERTINWAACIPADAGDLDHCLIDRQGRRRNGAVPSGHMREDLDDELKALMARELPDCHADILAKSTGNQIQLIYTSELPGYGKGRMGLCGDAGVVVQPMTGAGAFRGLSIAADLVDALASHADVPTAVAAWSKRQAAVARRMLALGNQMEDAFIWNTIDLAGATAKTCRTWWHRSITIPGESSCFADAGAVVLTCGRAACSRPGHGCHVRPGAKARDVKFAHAVGVTVERDPRTALPNGDCIRCPTAGIVPTRDRALPRGRRLSGRDFAVAQLGIQSPAPAEAVLELAKHRQTPMPST